jgi:transcriptional regulator with XRE-family HTH domain
MHVLKFIVANNILRLRTDAEISRAELGEKICYSEDYILKWERAEAMPDDDAIAALAKAFGVTADYLLNPHDEWISKEEKEYLENASTLASSGETKNLRREEEKNDEIPLAPSAEEAAAEPYGRDIITPLSISIGAIITLVIILFIATGGRFGCASKLPDTETEASKAETHLHEYGAWELAVPPAEHSLGEMRRYCYDCDEYEVHTLEASTGSLFYDDNGDGTCTVTGIGYGPESTNDLSSIVIPSYITDIDENGDIIELKVTAIGDEFLGSFGPDILSGVENIFLPDTVTSIGYGAFSGTAIGWSTLPDGLTYIGDYAFAECESLVEITLPESIEYLGEGAFRNCASLTEINMRNRVTEIKPYTFQNCYNLESIYLDGDVRIIGESAFNGCTALRYIDVPNCENLSYIGDYAFYSCTALENVYVPTGSAAVITLGASAFNGCTALTSFDMGALASIGDYAFEGCYKLESVWTRAEYIGIGAFKDCTGIKELYIVDGVKEIGAYAFEGCTGITSVSIPESVDIISAYAFKDCTALASFTTHGSLDSIGVGVFAGCTGLAEVTLNDMNGTGFEDAFRENRAITSVTVMTGEIPAYSFYGCTGLRSVILREGVTKIGDCAFERTRNAEHSLAVSFPESLSYIGAYAFASSGVTSFYMETETYIGDYAFSASALESVQLRSTSVTYGSYVFADCENLTELFIAENIIEEIGIGMFAGCEALTKVMLPSTITSLGARAFDGCTSLREVDIRSGAKTNIGDNAFRGCTSLEKIRFCGTADEMWAVLGNGLKETEGISNYITIVGTSQEILGEIIK